MWYVNTYYFKGTFYAFILPSVDSFTLNFRHIFTLLHTLYIFFRISPLFIFKKDNQKYEYYMKGKKLATSEEERCRCTCEK